METFKYLSTPIGILRIAASVAGLTSVVLIKEKHQEVLVVEEVPCNVLIEAENQLQGYFNGSVKQFDLTLDWSGMPDFRKKVLEKTTQIQWGEVVTYGELAKRAGNPRGARAVGGALANNPFLLVVPCHRVIASDGSMHGFSAEGGIKVKQRLLEFEGQKFINGKVIFPK